MLQTVSNDNAVRSADTAAVEASLLCCVACTVSLLSFSGMQKYVKTVDCVTQIEPPRKTRRKRRLMFPLKIYCSLSFGVALSVRDRSTWLTILANCEVNLSRTSVGYSRVHLTTIESCLDNGTRR